MRPIASIPRAHGVIQNGRLTLLGWACRIVPMLKLDTSRRLQIATLKTWLAAILHRRPPDAWIGLTTVEPDRPVRFVCPSDVSVTCVFGTAWITTGAETRDVVLNLGQRHVASRNARLFINGMPRCVLHLEPKARS